MEARKRSIVYGVIFLAALALAVFLAYSPLARKGSDSHEGASGSAEQVARPTVEDAQERLGRLAAGEAELPEEKGAPVPRGGDPRMPDLSDVGWLQNLDKLDESTREALFASLRASFTYHQTGLQHRLRVFEWQLFSSKLIFVTVLLLVFSGIVFAGIQFFVGLRSGANEQSHVRISTEGVQVSSPVLGVVILVISLAFFYLYLVYVYPIEEIF